MQRSIDTLLLLARLEAGQHPAAPDPLDLAQLMRDLLAAVQRQADERQLHIHAPLPAAAWVQADLGIVERIVSNLLRNAVEYTLEGGAITCQLERSAPRLVAQPAQSGAQFGGRRSAAAGAPFLAQTARERHLCPCGLGAGAGHGPGTGRAMAPAL